MRFGIDLDGCMYDWEDGLRVTALSYFGVSIPAPSQGWGWTEAHLTEEQVAQLWSEPALLRSMFTLGRDHDAGIAAVNALIGEGHEVHFVTHRPATVASITARWISDRFDGFSSIRIANHRQAKSTVLPAPDAFVDDRPSVIEDLLTETAAHVFMPKLGWNDGTEAPPCDALPATCRCRAERLTKFDDWEEVLSWARQQQ